MKKINLIVNGELIKSEPCTSVLQAALDAGIDIPHACYVPDADLPVEECKLCIVEIDGRIATACTEPVTEGMIIFTSTQEIERMRRRRLHFPG